MAVTENEPIGTWPCAISSRKRHRSTMPPGELPRAGYEAGDAALVAVDVLEGAAAPARETDAEDRADVPVGDRLDHALVEALDRLDRLGEQHPLLEVAQRNLRRVLHRGEQL